jgi:hypothetical protein
VGLGLGPVLALGAPAPCSGSAAAVSLGEAAAVGLRGTSRATVFPALGGHMATAAPPPSSSASTAAPATSAARRGRRRSPSSGTGKPALSNG